VSWAVIEKQCPRKNIKHSWGAPERGGLAGRKTRTCVLQTHKKKSGGCGDLWSDKHASGARPRTSANLALRHGRRKENQRVLELRRQWVSVKGLLCWSGAAHQPSSSGSKKNHSIYFYKPKKKPMSFAVVER